MNLGGNIWSMLKNRLGADLTILKERPRIDLYPIYPTGESVIIASLNQL